MAAGGALLRVGVIGVGYFGRFHALKFARHPRVDFVGLADPDPARAVDVAAECGVQAYCEPEALIGVVDAVSIAAPAHLHGPLAVTFLESGAHVLVEKPIAASLGEADAILSIAAAKGLVVQVGHQERAVLAEAGLFDFPETPTRIHCVRKGPFTGRNIDVDVVLDLLTHDLDMAHALNGAPIEKAEAQGQAVKTPLLDEVAATLTLSNGCAVTLEGSRVNDKRDRRMRIEYPSGVVAIDFLARTMDNSTPFALKDLFPAGEDNQGVAGDPLGYALDRFISACLDDGAPLVSGEDARFALAAAAAIQRAAGF